MCKNAITNKEEQPLMVTIRCATYNHEPYIRQCLEGFVMQKTNFRFEAIVHDDASTDGTADIIREYAKKYPDIIKPILETENQYSKHDGSIRRIMNAHTRGKYVAMCEGDDYWTDPFKLQKQVDFLELNKEYSFCCTRYKIYDEDKLCFLKEYAYSYYNNTDLEIDVSLFTKVWVTQILTTVIRKDCYLLVQREADKYKYFKDVHMYYLLLKLGKGISLNTFTGVYRWHNGGVASKISIENKAINGYNTYRELYLRNDGDGYLLNRYKKALLGYVRYSAVSIKLLKVLFENMGLFKGLDLVNYLFSFFMPKCCWKIVLKGYMFMRLNRQCEK